MVPAPADGVRAAVSGPSGLPGDETGSTRGRLPPVSDHARAAASLALAVGVFWGFVVVVEPLISHAPAGFESVGPPALLALVLGSWSGGGVWFARVVGRRLGGGGWRGPVAGGLAAPVVTLATFAAALSVEQFAVTEGRVAAALMPYVFTAAFAPYAAGLVLVLTLAAGLGTGSRTWRSALAAAALTATVFVALSLVLNQVPGWRVGGGERAMVKVALVANTLAAAAGGAAALALVARGGRVRRRAI